MGGYEARASWLGPYDYSGAFSYTTHSTHIFGLIFLSTDAMPTLTAANSTVLVTGANGYIGAWTVKTALEHGFAVRAVVRSEAKADWLKKIFASYLNNAKVEFVYVSDLTAEGAFDEAVKGVDAVLHLASPLPSSSPDPQGMPVLILPILPTQLMSYIDTIRPAVNGTLGVLKSALKNG